MWIVNFLPVWVFQLIVAAGIAGFVASFALRMIPLVSSYVVPIRVISGALLCMGLWFMGAHSNNEAWLARVKELEKKVEVAEAKSKEENVRVETKVVTQVKVVKERGQDIVKFIDREIIKYDVKFAPGGQCEIPKEFIEAHNKAAEVPK